MKELEKLIQTHYDRFEKKWYSNKEEKIVATEDETIEYQAKVRFLRFQEQMKNEEAIVLGKKDTNLQPAEVLKYMPLVSRRKHPELWSHIGAFGKLQQDGNLFTFKPVITMNVCGCTDEQLYNEYLNSSMKAILFPSVGQTVEERNEAYSKNITNYLRAIHNKSFDDDDTEVGCENPKAVPEGHQYKHTIGNWNCKACLNLGSSITSADDADKAVASSTKALEWCPRFIRFFRHQPIAEYLKALEKEKNKTCYAGLVHTEMHFEEEIIPGETYMHGFKECSCTNDQLNLELTKHTLEQLTGFTGDNKTTNVCLALLRQQHTLRLEGVHNTGPQCPDGGKLIHREVTPKEKKTYVVITKKCDTCDYTLVEKKEYHQPEPIEADQLLMHLPESE